MCGRYSIDNARQFVRQQLGLADLTDDGLWTNRYNVAPSQSVPVVRTVDGGTAELVAMKWGFVPRFVKDEKPKSKPINARCETVATHRYFRHAFAHQRCLLPATGFYEWKAGKEFKQPYNFHMRNAEPFYMAGIWDTWRDELRVAIIVGTANTLIGPMHDRMPIIVPRARCDEWLTTDAPEQFLTPYPADEMQADPVSTAVNNPRYNAPDLLHRITVQD